MLQLRCLLPGNHRRNPENSSVLGLSEESCVYRPQVTVRMEGRTVTGGPFLPLFEARLKGCDARTAHLVRASFLMRIRE